jgi:hypothetical protein
VKSIELDLAGARLRQDVARGDGCASASHQDRRTDQAKQKYPRQQRTEADNTPFPGERIERAPDTLCRQPTLLGAVRRHYQSPDRKEVRMFAGVSIGKILNLVGLHSVIKPGRMRGQIGVLPGPSVGAVCLHYEIDQ